MSTSIPLSELESSAAAKFENIGDKHVGVITGLKQTQQTDPNTGQPKHFPSGDPIMLWIITLQPAEGGDPVALWAKGGSNFVAVKGSGDSMLVAIGKAVREAGASSVDVGGTLAVAFTGETEPKPGLSAARLFTAQYKPPAEQPSQVPVDDLFSS